MAVQNRDRRPLLPFEARLRVVVAGICSTDLALLAGSIGTRRPQVLGHEFVGRVIEVGRPGASEWIGRRVCSAINVTCGSRNESPCAACVEIDPRQCLRREVLGIDVADGAFAEEVIVPLNNLHELPPEVTDRAGTFVEPLAAAVAAFDRVPATPGLTIVVLGGGRLGSLIARVAVTRGHTVLTCMRSDRHARRLHELGVGEILRGDRTFLLNAVKDRTKGLGAHFAVEATGTEAGLAQAIELVRPRGTVVLKTTNGLPAFFNLTDVVVREVTFAGSRCGDFAAAISLLSQRFVQPEALVCEEFELGEIADAVRAAKDELKVLVRMA